MTRARGPSAPRAAVVSQALSPQQRAKADAASILAAFIPPPAAQRLVGPPGDVGGKLDNPIFMSGDPDTVYSASLWKVPGMSPLRVLTWEMAHLSSRFRLTLTALWRGGTGAAGHPWGANPAERSVPRCKRRVRSPGGQHPPRSGDDRASRHQLRRTDLCPGRCPGVVAAAAARLRTSTRRCHCHHDYGPARHEQLTARRARSCHAHRPGQGGQDRQTGRQSSPERGGWLPRFEREWQGDHTVVPRPRQRPCAGHRQRADPELQATSSSPSGAWTSQYLVILVLSCSASRSRIGGCPVAGLQHARLTTCPSARLSAWESVRSGLPQPLTCGGVELPATQP